MFQTALNVKEWFDMISQMSLYDSKTKRLSCESKKVQGVNLFAFTGFLSKNKKAKVICTLFLSMAFFDALDTFVSLFSPLLYHREPFFSFKDVLFP
jgi:hypothetical protein